ncbi:hypothetical protein [Streptomyces sp. t39]|uniref:hypothetical protein n=1 Tax=Streptomyces sp. t39 TaxID=1828156 RepID=UPI0011CDAE38|nr:hypothetical protein [Streptomyces sp. t39]TXS52263.1 hypothetical protein EAO77_20905 [Streptomyces sp. t39]
MTVIAVHPAECSPARDRRLIVFLRERLAETDQSGCGGERQFAGGISHLLSDFDRLLARTYRGEGDEYLCGQIDALRLCLQSLAAAVYLAHPDAPAALTKAVQAPPAPDTA